MCALSLRGVLRRYGGITGKLSVRSVSGTGGSLRPALESMARQEFAFPMSECIYEWTAAFEQIWTHIIVRIQLNPDAGILFDTMNNLMTTWKNGIENTWSNQWGCEHPGEANCRLTFEVQWVNANQHHSVRVRTGPAPTNSGNWDLYDTSASASHEFGHLIGLTDEYSTDPNCPDRNPVNTGSIMDNNSSNIPARMMDRFAQNIGSNVVSI
jgi:hypothetical protein